MRNAVFHTQKQPGSAWHVVAFGFISGTLGTRAILGEEIVLCDRSKSFAKTVAIIITSVYLTLQKGDKVNAFG